MIPLSPTLIANISQLLSFLHTCFSLPAPDTIRTKLPFTFKASPERVGVTFRTAAILAFSDLLPSYSLYVSNHNTPDLRRFYRFNAKSLSPVILAHTRQFLNPFFSAIISFANSTRIVMVDTVLPTVSVSYYQF